MGCCEDTGKVCNSELEAIGVRFFFFSFFFFFFRMVSQLLETFTTLVNRYKVRSVTLITETSIFHGFIGAINDCFLTNQSARSILIILQT